MSAPAFESPSAAERLAKIQSHLATPGNQVLVATHYKQTTYSHAHLAMFRASGRSLYVQRGKSWDCIDYCSIRFGTPREVSQ